MLGDAKVLALKMIRDQHRHAKSEASVAVRSDKYRTAQMVKIVNEVIKSLTKSMASAIASKQDPSTCVYTVDVGFSLHRFDYLDLHIKSDVLKLLNERLRGSPPYFTATLGERRGIRGLEHFFKIGYVTVPVIPSFSVHLSKSTSHDAASTIPPSTVFLGGSSYIPKPY